MNTISEETKNLLLRYFRAAVHLYGIIPLHKLLSIYNSQNEAITEEQILDFVENIDYSNEHFAVIGDDEVYEDVSETKPIERNLVAEYMYALGDFDDYCEIQEGQIGKSYYIPNKEKFSKYEDEWYFEKTLEFISLRAFIRNQSYLSKEKADEIAEEIVFRLSVNSGELDSAVRQAVFLGLKLDSKQMYDEFVSLAYEVSNNTRMHINCGHTPMELCK